MRIAVTALVVVMGAASVAQGQVHLSINRNGKKVISNFDSGRNRRGSDLTWLAKQHDRRSEFDDIIERHSSRYGVDPVLVRAVIQVESNFNPDCVSHKGARGLMQLMPGTAKRYGVRTVHDPEQNIHGGIRYLAYLSELFPNDLSRVLAAYNAGENAVLRHGGVPPYEETTTYVRRALTVYHGRPYGQAVSFAAGRVKKLKGGFGTGAAQPLATALVPGMRYLGAVGR